jgi:carboxyl-terminal processing protease
MKEQFATPEEFISDFNITEKFYNNFLEFAEENNVAKDPNGIAATGDKIKVLLKAYIGRNVFNDKAFYPVYNQSDPVFLRAVEELTKKNPTGDFLTEVKSQ